MAVGSSSDIEVGTLEDQISSTDVPRGEDEVFAQNFESEHDMSVSRSVSRQDRRRILNMFSRKRPEKIFGKMLMHAKSFLLWRSSMTVCKAHLRTERAIRMSS